MKKIQIIGAGQLGSRHLQALKSLSEPLEITVVDPSEESLKVARERYDGLTQGTSHPVTYQREIAASSQPWDLVIVPTSSNVRRGVMEKLLSASKVKFLVLEKILFDRKSDYEAAERMISESGTKAWVNCCMRQMPIYQEIARAVAGKPFHFVATGSQFGLITNAIHYFDYMAFIARNTRFKVSTSGLEKEPIPSKRKGFLEFNGSLVADFENGSHGSVTCFSGGALPALVQVQSETHRYLVRESERKAWVATAESQWQWKEIDAVIPFQSQLTGELAKMIFEKGDCPLPTLKESIPIHLALLEPIREHVARSGAKASNEYPFT